MKKEFAIFFTILICATLFCSLFFTSGKLVEPGPVENEERAIEIAKAYVWKKYYRSFRNHEIKAELTEGAWLAKCYEGLVEKEEWEDDVWSVWYVSESDMGGGLPEVHINKSDGKVVLCFLAK